MQVKHQINTVPGQPGFYIGKRTGSLYYLVKPQDGFGVMIYPRKEAILEGFRVGTMVKMDPNQFICAVVADIETGDMR